MNNAVVPGGPTFAEVLSHPDPEVLAARLRAEVKPTVFARSTFRVWSVMLSKNTLQWGFSIRLLAARSTFQDWEELDALLLALGVPSGPRPNPSENGVRRWTWSDRELTTKEKEMIADAELIGGLMLVLERRKVNDRALLSRAEFDAVYTKVWMKGTGHRACLCAACEVERETLWQTLAARSREEAGTAVPS